MVALEHFLPFLLGVGTSTLSTESIHMAWGHLWPPFKCIFNSLSLSVLLDAEDLNSLSDGEAKRMAAVVEGGAAEVSLRGPCLIAMPCCSLTALRSPRAPGPLLSAQATLEKQPPLPCVLV